jgi:putative transposase
LKETRFTEAQMVTILRAATRSRRPTSPRKHGISTQTIYGRRKHFGTQEPADVKRLRQLEQENGRLEKMVADRALEIDVLKEITRKQWQAHKCAGNRSPRRRARPVPPPRGRPAVCGAVDGRLCVAPDHPGSAGRSHDAHVGGASIRGTLIARSESSSNATGTLWARTACIASGTKTSTATDADSDESRVAYDVIFDTCADGRTLKCLTVIDEFTRQCVGSTSPAAFAEAA